MASGHWDIGLRCYVTNIFLYHLLSVFLSAIYDESEKLTFLIVRLLQPGGTK